ncbi:uncharacterized protein LOC103489701 [Cucumis melo]|uniref:Uncharacterized protein LOC103489701 n=1 Tax=Cucumis melo TaxID=3656 RepID=A0A1S3BHQ3_CUCME|nr:uncharacterized protein LOC103489701 [Cucumis melo]
MSCETKKEQWIQIHDTTTPCVINFGKHAVDDHNKEKGDNLVFKKVIIGWYLEIDYNKTKLRLIIEVVNSKGEVITFEVVIVVDDKDGKTVKTVISFVPGHIDEKNPWTFWIKIHNVTEPHVQEIAKFAVEEHNKITHDNLIYICIIEGWYHVSTIPPVTLWKLHLKAKDCLGRVREYEALVKEEKLLPKHVLKLEHFIVIPKIC